MYLSKIIFKKIKFINIGRNNFYYLIKKKGLFVFPSGPGLSTLEREKKYHIALKNSDYVFFDSGYFVLLLKILKKINVLKFSGYLFLNLFFKFLYKKKNIKIFSIDPSLKSSQINFNFLSKKILIKKVKSYVAPIYKNNFKDKILIKQIKKFKPNYILINLGGGVQEILGFEIKKNINFNTSIFCTGGAISYFTKEQAPINNFLDKFYLGWLTRILFNPLIFLPRYFKTINLFWLVLRSKIEVVE